MTTLSSCNSQTSENQILKILNSLEQPATSPQHQPSTLINVDQLYKNISSLIESVTQKQDDNKEYVQQQIVITENHPINITFEQDPTQLKMKIRTLEIQVNVQKGRISQLESQKQRLCTDIEDLKAQMGLNTHVNTSISKSETANQQILVGEIERLRAQIERIASNDKHMLRQREYEMTIRNLTIQIERLMNINEQKANIQHNNQVLRGEINKLLQINRVLGQQNLILKSNINSYNQQRIQLYQHLEISRQLDNRNRILQSTCQKLQIQVNNYKMSQNNTKSRSHTNDIKFDDRDNIVSRMSASKKNFRQPSPLNDLPDGSKYKPITTQSPTKQIKDNKLSKVMSPSNRDKATDNTKWIRLQDRINALKSENEELKKSIYSK